MRGKIKAPGDKSISIRALILAGLAEGESKLSGLPQGDDAMSTLLALERLGVGFDWAGRTVTVTGLGGNDPVTPDLPLDLGNSGTGSRLLIGALAGRNITACFTGDASLKTRPFDRVVLPLSKMGAGFDGTTLPLTMTGSRSLKGITYTPPVPSAQVKSAILLAGLGATGVTTVVEETPTRDHTERMMKAFGVTIETIPRSEGRAISVKGPQTPKATDFAIPGDISGAAFAIVAGLITGSRGLVIEGVGVNPTRVGVLNVLRKMGAGITLKRQKNDSGEPMADIYVNSGPLAGVTTKPEDAPFLIDEFPILFAAAAFAMGRSKFKGLSELRHKESDRLAIMAEGLKANGAQVQVSGDDLIIEPGPVRGGAVIDARHDHRIAMSFLVLGLAAENPVTVKGAETISTSFPGFAKVMGALGARIEELK